MAKIGTLVRVIFPEYAVGIRGRIEGQEESGRWLVKLERHPIKQNNEPFILSLDKEDFEEIG